MAAPIKKIIHRFIYNISEYEPGGSQSNKVIPLDTQIYAYYPEAYDKEVHDTGLYFVFGDGQHTYDEIRRGLGIYDTSKEYGTYNPQEIAELKRMIEERVPKNEHAVSGTGTKVTTDENGLVIDLTTLDQDDIPEIPLSKVYDVFASPEEINRLLGVTDNVQGQLDTLTQGLSTEVVTRIADVQTLTTNLSNEVTARTNADTNLQNQINSLDGNAVKYDENQGVVDKNSITLEGTGAGTKITNLAPGTLNANSKDAVNGSQLYTTNQSVSDVASDLSDLSDVVDTKQPKLTAANAGDGISITGEGSNVLITNTNFSAIWGNIQGTLSDQTDLQNVIDDLGTRINSNKTNIGTLSSLTTDAKGNLVSAINEVDSHTDTNTTNIGTLSNLTTSEKSTIVGAINELGSNIGDKSTLTTDAKNNIVSAINEVDSHTDTNMENIGTLNSLTTDEKSTIVGAINEVDLHADTNTSNIGNLTNLTTENKANIVSAINELDSTKQDNITGAATTILNNNLTKNRVVISNNSGKIAVSDITSTELNYLDNVTSNVQEQINSKVAKNDDIVGATHTKITYDSKGLVTSGEDLIQSDIPGLNLTKIIDVTASAEEVNVLDGITASTTELNYVDGVTSNIQDQLDTKVVKNDAITAATKTKITYDSKGLVTSGTDLIESDIPSLHLNKISDVTATATEVNVLHGITASTTELNYTDGVTSNIQTQLDTKVVKNDNITAGTHTKITYDSKGLVTSGEELVQDDIPDLNLTKVVDVTATAEEVNVLDGITASTAELNYTDGVTSPIQDQLDSKVAKNDAITAATHTKITYDSKGLVTGGSDIVTSDVTDLTATSTEINQLHESNIAKADLTKLHNVTATANELNILHGATLDTTELNYVDGVTSSIQTQIDSKRTKIEDANKVYTTDNLANQSSITYDTSNSASTIVQRDASSQINVAQTPTANTHATSKKYVDDKISAAVTEAVVFKGIVADETELPSSGNTNGDMYWITAYSNNPPTGMVSGRSGAAIYKVTGTTGEWNYTQDAIYQPDNQSVSLNANGELQVMVSSIENNSVTKKSDGLHVDITGKVDKNTTITGATKCKITYDSKGLVTAGADLVASDIPSLTLNKISDVTATAAEVNVLDGITTSTTELNYVDGVTSPIQTQIDSKVAKNDSITGATRCKITYDSKGLVTAGADLISSDIPNLALTKIYDVTATAEEVNVLDGITTSTTELNYVDGVTSPIQAQLDSKVIKNDAITGATHTKITYDSKGLVTSGTDLSASDIPSLTLDKISDVIATAAEVNVLDGITASTTELNYVDGVTSNVQTQLDSKVAKNDDIIAATHTKITYDAKGLVTGGTELSASDIPSLTLSKISDVTATAAEVNVLDGITTSTTELNYVDGVTSPIQTQIDSKVAKNNAITAGTHTKITYDSKGLVTGGTELSASDIPSLTLDKISDVTATAAEVNVLDGITASTTELNYVEGVTSSIQTQINNEISNRETAVSNEATTRETEDGKLSAAITSEATTRSTEDGKLSTAIANEKTRAEGAESNLNTAIGNEKTRAETAEGNLDTAITNEVTRATEAESDLQDAITAEETAREDADTNLSNLITGVADDLASEITRATGVEDNLQDDIDTINSKIPSAASSSNKLVDNSAFTTELNKKVDKTTTGNVVYGTDANGDQTVHSIDSFGKVDDVKIGNTSLVTNKIASIPLAGSGTVGVASFANANGLNVDANGAVSLVAASQQEIVAKTEAKKPITPSNLAYAIEKGLGANGLTWTDQEKSSARSTIGAQATITGAATTITSNDLTTDRVIVSNINGKVAVSDITTTELGYLDDATSNIQQQINSLDTNKVNKNNAITAGTATRITYDTKGLVTAGANDLTVSDITDLTASAADINILTDTEVTNTELGYVHGVTESIQDQLTTLSSELDAEIDARETVDQTQGTYISNIQAVIPPAATSSNQLADKEYVNDLVQSTAADFRGSWNTYADVPTNSNLYPEDETGSRIPNTNDYIIIQRDETQDGGTWRYKYTGVWATDNKAGWTAEYEINANPLTQDQIAALDSGITDVLVAQISTNEDDITALSNSKQNNITGAASSVTTNNLDPSVVVVTNSQGKLDDSNVSVTELGYLSGVTSSIQTQLNGKQSNLSATQLNAVNSGITEVLRQSYDAHVADTDIHVTTQDKTNWSAKQEALNTTQMNAVNSGITTALREGYDTHVADTDIHITTQERTTWNAKQNAISDLSDIRSGAAAGATAVQDVTVNGTSIVSNKSATIPLAAINGDYGLVKLGAASYGIAKNTTNNFLYLNAASSEDITAKTSAYKPIVPSNLDNAVKTSVTTNTNTLTDNEKAAAQTWLGVDTELAKKQNNLTGAATTIASSNLTASRALISNASGKVAVSDITSTELSYLDGVTSNIQTQLGNLGTNKADKATTLAGYGITDAYTKTEVDEKIAGVYIYKGSVATESDLPATGNRTGDIYNVESDGTNWAWNGTAWDNLGALIDLSVKQDVLVSGTNIKTINNNSILGSGNLSLPTTISGLDDTTISTTSNGQFLVYDSTTSKWKNTTVHIPNDANNATITIKDAANTTIGDFTTDQSSAETITIPTATKTALGLVKVDDALSSSSTNPVQNKVINTALSGKQANLDTDQLAAVNSGINSTLVGKITANESAISTINSSDVMTSGITPTLVTTYSTHVSNSNIHVTSDQKLAWTGKQDALVSGTNIKTINGNSILGSGNLSTDPFPTQSGNSGKFLTTNGSSVSWASVDAFPTQTGNTGKVLKTNGSAVSWETIGDSGDVIPFGTSESAADATQKNVTISSITSLKTGQIIIVQPTVTSTVANSTIKLNTFDAYPMRYNNSAITTSTDSIVWCANIPSWWRFDGSYWVFLGHGLDSDTTYTVNYSIDSGVYKCGTGSYPVTRYSIIAQKADGTWEKVTATSSSYNTDTNKVVNSNGFILNQFRYLNAKTEYTTAGAAIATNTVYEKAASVDLRYSTNCGNTTTFAIGDYIYFVGTIGNDGLFYLSSSNWWTNTLPTTNDGKLYVRMGIALAAAGYTMSFFEDRPIFYHNGTKICEYKVADNKQDLLVSGTNIKTINGNSLVGSGNVVIDSLPAQSGNANKFLTTNGTSASWVNVPNEIPSQTGNNGKFLTTDGNNVSWATITIPTVDQTYNGGSTNAQSGVAVKSAIDAAISSVYKPAGSVAFANKPSLSSSIEGNVYNITDAFTTTSDFVEGAGSTYPAGTNIVCINTATSGSAVYKWDVLAGFVDLSSYQTTITGAASTITTSNLSTLKALVSDSSGKVAASSVTSTELGYLSGVTSAIQTQINDKVTKNNNITGATKCKITYDSKGLVTAGADLSASDIPSLALTKISDVTATASEVNVLDGITASTAELNVLDGITASTTELNYVDGVTSNVQDQLNSKLNKLTYEWNNEIGFGSTGVLCIGKFCCYDTNITVDIDATTASTYHGTLVIATQNMGTSSGGNFAANVYDDATNAIAPNIHIYKHPANDCLVEIYFTPQPWSKNLIHIRAVALNKAHGTVTYDNLYSDICTNVSEAPAEATIVPTNALDSKQAKLVSGTNIKTINNSSILGSGNIDTHEIPSQTGNSGKFLTTNGSAVSWGSIGLTYNSSSETLTLNIG